MLFTDPVFVGVSPAIHQKSFVYAAMDKNLSLVALAEGGLDEIVAFLAGQRTVMAAVNAPSGLNRGLAVEKKKEMFKSRKEKGSGGYRLAESELRTRGILVRGTPSTLGACPEWMKAGISLHRKLEKNGFVKYPADDETHQLFETSSHAGFCVLAGEAPLSKASLEGKIQRQLLLYENGVGIKDPMDFFEEITRHKMLKGTWPMELLYHPDQLDAMVAALTAWKVTHKPESVCQVGDVKEGIIFLPAQYLKEKY
ncbi:MAG: DUF429 domain-containing protein [Anaerolineales bacterium]|nr:DUF429 domain-containing protein [Anaerolineales bacterium]